MRELLLLALVVISVPLVLRRPLLGMIIYLGANIVRPEMLFWGGGSGSYIFMLYYALTLVGMYFQNDFRNINRIARREFMLLVWLLAAILVSVVLAQYPIFRGYYYVLEILKGFGICALLYILINDFEDIKTVQNVLLGCFFFLAIWGIDQHLRGNERLEGLGGGAWGDSNGVAAIFILFLPIALAKAFSSENRKELLISFGIVALMVAIVVCTKSRSGLIGLIIAMAMFAFYARKAAKLALVALVLVLIAVPFATEDYFNRMKTMEGPTGISDSARDRITLWKAGLMVFADNPLVGTGFLTYPIAKMKYEYRFEGLDTEFRKEIFRTEYKKVTHNTYIQLLSDCGLFGAVPFLLVIGSGILRGFTARRYLATATDKKTELLWLCGFSAGMAGYAVCILSIDAVYDMQLYFQFVLASILYGKTIQVIRAQPVEAVQIRNRLVFESNAT